MLSPLHSLLSGIGGLPTKYRTPMVSSRRDRVDSAAPTSPLFLSAYPPCSATPPGLVFVVRAPSRDSGIHPRVTTARSSSANLLESPADFLTRAPNVRKLGQAA